MSFFKYSNIKISAISASIPTEIVTIDSFKNINDDKKIERFKTLTGIKEFRRALPNQTAADLGFVAALRILEERKIDVKEIGACIFVSHTPDYRSPSTACVLHYRLGLSKDCVAYDINLGCSAIAYGLQNVSALLSSSNMKYGLLIVGDTMSKLIGPKDQSVNMLFGDGGAAFLLEKDEGPFEQISILLKTDGNGYNKIITPAGGFRNMFASHDEMLWSDGNIRSLYNTYMNGTHVFSFSIMEVPKSIDEFFNITATSVDDYDCFAFHQANKYILDQISKRNKIPVEKMPITLDRFANTSASSSALSLCDAYGGISGVKINTLFCCFGVGLSWGVVSAKIDSSSIYPIIETDDYFKEGIIEEPM